MYYGSSEDEEEGGAEFHCNGRGRGVKMVVRIESGKIGRRY